MDRVVAECKANGPLTAERIGEMLGRVYGPDAVAQLRRSLAVVVTVVGQTRGKKGCIRNLYRVEAANG
jgi:hypothetical protein